MSKTNYVIVVSNWIKEFIHVDTPSSPVTHGKKHFSLDSDYHNVDIEQLSKFIFSKMTESVVAKSWTHIDSHKKGFIEQDDMLHTLVLISGLYIGYLFKSHNLRDNTKEQPKMDKHKLRKHFQPLNDWIIKTKMPEKPRITQNEFQQTMGSWLHEFAMTLPNSEVQNR